MVVTVIVETTTKVRVVFEELTWVDVMTVV